MVMKESKSKKKGKIKEKAVSKKSEAADTAESFDDRENGEIKVRECCSHKTKARSEEEYKRLINRLNRIEGQIRGIKGMLENNAYCTDILMQVSAVNSALNSFNKELLASHIKTCVADDIRTGNDETINELVTILQKLMR